MTEREKMTSGELYRPGDPELAQLRKTAQALMRAYNQTIVGEEDVRGPILAKLLGRRGAGTQIRPAFYCDYGVNIFFGDNCFLNYGCVFLDVCPIHVGHMTQIGPLVQVLTADHPRDPDVRDAGFENGAPVTIGRNVWIGGGAILLPGIRVGDDAIIGAGAVVTRDVAKGATVVGNPARPLGSKNQGS